MVIVVKKEYEYLFKTLVLKNGPEGLYPEPCVWMEGKDLEGFNAHFSYGFIKKPCSLHPVKETLVHPYNELLVFAGTDNTNILNLGAEISVELGEEREVHTFTDPSVIIVPKGMPHGPVTIKNISRPIVHFAIGLSPTYKAASLTGDSKKSANKGAKYTHLVKKLITYFMMQPPPTVGQNQNVGSGMGYEKV